MVERIPTGKLVESVRRLKTELGETPSYSQYHQRGEFSITTLESRFGSWTEARERAGLSEGRLPGYRIDEGDLLDDLKRVASKVDGGLTRDEYREYGEYGQTTVRTRFGSWNDALREAGLDINKEWSKDREVYQCDNCGEEVLKLPSQVKNQKHVFCSRECQYSGLDQSGESNPNYRGGKSRVECATCGAELKRKPAVDRDRDNHFCSRECYGEWKSEHFTGENHPRWVGGRETYYGPNWLRQRRAARDRDDFECQDCGMTDAEHLDKYGIELEVHHKTPIREFVTDGDLDHEAANDLSNLITLCRACHRQRDG